MDRLGHLRLLVAPRAEPVEDPGGRYRDGTAAPEQRLPLLGEVERHAELQQPPLPQHEPLADLDPLAMAAHRPGDVEVARPWRQERRSVLVRAQVTDRGLCR